MKITLSIIGIIFASVAIANEGRAETKVDSSVKLTSGVQQTEFGTNLCGTFPRNILKTKTVEREDGFEVEYSLEIGSESISGDRCEMRRVSYLVQRRLSVPRGQAIMANVDGFTIQFSAN